MVFSDISFKKIRSIYISQVVRCWFEIFFLFIKGDFRWYFAAPNQLFIFNRFLIKTGRKRRSSFFIDIFWLGKNKFDKVGLLQV
jgi:hypothetical protein